VPLRLDAALTYYTAMKWAYQQKLGGPTKSVLLALVNRTDSAGKCWPSIATLADDSGFSQRTVKRSLEALVAAGLVTRRPQYNTLGRTSNMYTVKVPQAPTYGLTGPNPQAPQAQEVVKDEVRQRSRPRAPDVMPDGAPDPAVVEWMERLLAKLNSVRPAAAALVKPTARVRSACRNIRTAGWSPGQAYEEIANNYARPIDLRNPSTDAGLIVRRIEELSVDLRPSSSS
jgi:hypothetical protein